MIGVAASSASREAVLIAAVAGLVAGAMSMAVGEYVSVSAQRDAEQADVERKRGARASTASGTERAGPDAWRASGRGGGGGGGVGCVGCGGGVWVGVVGGWPGECVGSAQRDAERADVERETRELARQPRAELNELALIYVKRGLDKELAMKVAEQLSTRDRLGAHLRDELGIDQASLARPMQAAWISAASFASFAVVPIVALLVAPAASRIPAIAAVSLVSLAALGAFGGHLGGAPLGRAALRVTIGGALAMAVTAAIGRIVGVAIG